MGILHFAVKAGLVLIHHALFLAAVLRRRRRGAVGGRPLGGDLDAVAEELHRAVAGDVAVAELAEGTVQPTEGEWFCTTFTEEDILELGNFDEMRNNTLFVPLGTGMPTFTPNIAARKRLINHSAFAPFSV